LVGQPPGRFKAWPKDGSGDYAAAIAAAAISMTFLIGLRQLLARRLRVWPYNDSWPVRLPSRQTSSVSSTFKRQGAILEPGA
jgi:hypothetical protein